MAKLARRTRASNDSLLGAAWTLLHASSSTRFNSVRVFASNDASMILNRVKRRINAGGRLSDHSLARDICSIAPAERQTAFQLSGTCVDRRALAAAAKG